MQKSVQLWLERSQYDWETAEFMMASGRYLYVAFMCQQAVEKLFKGYIHHQTGALPPYTHNLTKLAEGTDLHFSEDQLDFLALLTRYYLNTRYPDYKQKLAADLTNIKAQEIMGKSKEIIQCLREKLKM